MTLTVKLPPAIERDFEAHCRRNRLTKSEVVTRLLQQYLSLSEPKTSAYELAEQLGLVGALGDAPRDLSSRHSSHVKRVLRGGRSR